MPIRRRGRGGWRTLRDIGETAKSPLDRPRYGGAVGGCRIGVADPGGFESRGVGRAGENRRRPAARFVGVVGGAPRARGTGWSVDRWRLGRRTASGCGIDV